MLPIELNHEQERKLEYIAMTQGLSKNDVVIAAIEQYFKIQDSETMPLSERVEKALFDIREHNLSEEKKALLKAFEVAHWAHGGGTWSAKPQRHTDGSSTGALYGFNEVLGYIYPRNSNIYVLSRYLGPITNSGVMSYSYNVMEFDKWKECMALLPNS